MADEAQPMSTALFFGIFVCASVTLTSLQFLQEHDVPIRPFTSLVPAWITAPDHCAGLTFPYSSCCSLVMTFLEDFLHGTHNYNSLSLLWSHIACYVLPL